MLTGFIAVFAALSSGEQAGEAAKSIGSLQAVLHDHEKAAEWVRNIFAIILLVKSLALFFAHDSTQYRLAISLLLAIGMWFLVRTGDLGGKLVFEHGAGVAPELIIRK